MIIFTVVTSFTDALFDALYADCSADMDAGSYPWHLFSASTDDEKRAHLKAAFNGAPFMFTVYEDDQPLMLNAGEVTNGTFKWYLGLIGFDTSGSKSWLYRDDYTQARNAFWPAQGITAWHIETMGSGTSMHDHVVSAVAAGKITDSLNSVVTEDPHYSQTELRFNLTGG